MRADNLINDYRGRTQYVAYLDDLCYPACMGDKPTPTQKEIHEPKHKRQMRKLIEIIGEDSILVRLLSFLGKEIVAMKDGWAAFLVMGLIVAFITYRTASDWVFAPQIDSLRKDLEGANGAKLEAETDRNKYQIEAQNAENALAPWKELANSQFPGKPINEGLSALLQKVDALQKAMMDDSLNPLKEPIASAIATATVNLKTDKPQPQGTAFGPRGMVGLGYGHNGLLIGETNQLQGSTDHDGITHYRIVAPCAVDDAYMGKPVDSLLNAQYIQIDMNAIWPNTDILGGTVVWVINNRITLTFEIPAQRSSPQGHIMIFNLSAGLSTLQSIAPISPTSDTSAAVQPTLK